MTNMDKNTDLTTADIAGERKQEKRGGPGGTATAPEAPLFQENEVTDLRSRWDNVQASFVDEPRKAVEQADQLVATAMKRLAIQRYRSFFARLLSV